MFTFQINVDRCRCQRKYFIFLYNKLLNTSPLVFWCYTDLAGSIPSCSWSSLGFVFILFSFVLAPCVLIPRKGWKMHRTQRLFAIHMNNFNWIHFLTLQFLLPYNFMEFSSYQVFLSPVSIITIISSKRSQIIWFISIS